MKERICANSEIKLVEKDNENNAIFKTFKIEKVIYKDSASVVVYEGKLDGVKGVLKEFYPLDFIDYIGRDGNNQLFWKGNQGDEYGEYLSRKEKYRTKNSNLRKLSEDDKNAEILKFLPHVEVYYGINLDFESVYIWTSEQRLKTFEEVCRDISENYNVEPMYKLVTVLYAIKWLTKCVLSLHEQGYIHQDIKPMNFGFETYNGEIKPEEITIFDFDSVVNFRDDNKEIVGTPGYCDMEFKNGDGSNYISNKVDIYAIGATLFRAIIVSDIFEEEDNTYSDSYYDRISELFESSKLIMCIKDQMHPRLKKKIIDILTKCLARRSKRYTCCEDLRDDIDEALTYASSMEQAKAGIICKNSVGSDFIRENTTFDSFNSIQYSLYEHPIYTVSNGDTINVMVIGLGYCGEKFLDTCLSVGQMLDKKLNVIVVSKDGDDKEIYLSHRKGLDGFFSIDGLKNDDNLNYGSIQFINKTFVEDSLIDENIINELHRKYGLSNYVFITLGNNRLNKKIAEIFPDNDFVTYVTESDEKSDRTNIIPLNIYQDVKRLPKYDEIEKMALNLHSLWSDEKDSSRIKAEYKEAYNHNSSICSVLSIKSKFKSLGIDIDSLGVDKAVKKYKEILGNDINHAIRNSLIYIEHRRWVADKLCNGWVGYNFDDLSNRIKDKDMNVKKHACITWSRAENPLKNENSFLLWEREEDLSILDGLDYMSVMFHRKYKENANLVKKRNLIPNTIRNVKSIISSLKRQSAYDELVEKCNSLIKCCMEIHHGKYKNIAYYNQLKQDVQNIMDDIPSLSEENLRYYLDEIWFNINQILMGQRYKNYKENDGVIIDNIPFILTSSFER